MRCCLDAVVRTMSDVCPAQNRVISRLHDGTLDALRVFMYSKARIAGHPVHPMLVALPIGLYVTAVASMLGFVGTQDPFYYRAAMYAAFAGVGMALVAAIPGAIDLFALPKGTRVRRTGIKHASMALLATGLFSISAALLYRGWHPDAVALDVTLPLAIGIGGVLVLVVVGGLGWALVQTHHVGVKPIVVHEHHRATAVDEYDDFSTPPAGLHRAARPSMRH